jgi:hypothetical protein
MFFFIKASIAKFINSLKPYRRVIQIQKAIRKEFIFMTVLKYGQNFTIFTKIKFYRWWGETLTIYTGVSTGLPLSTVLPNEENTGQLRIKDPRGDYTPAEIRNSIKPIVHIPIPRLVKIKCFLKTKVKKTF